VKRDALPHNAKRFYASNNVIAMSEKGKRWLDNHAAAG